MRLEAASRRRMVAADRDRRSPAGVGGLETQNENRVLTGFGSTSAAG